MTKELSKEDARSLADKFSCNQTYPRWASVVFVSTIRFTRVHLKYKYHRKSYAALHIELGHFSQTFYLMCTFLGLGAFVTAYVSNKDKDRILGIDGIIEGSVMLNGCGHPMKMYPTLDLNMKEYVPGKTNDGGQK
ncbi:nitroreductase family protein [Cuniculiplasma sp. SKW4]|uniref:nitroreductase family protein n=1 Tax=Cuniculiplasma sp. SKW4 TaxID=3400171 RepID=UPI003FD37671